MPTHADSPKNARTRWSAIGAAVAITLGAGGVSMSHAAVSSGQKPVTITVESKRILDTRVGLGIAGRFANATPRDLQVTGVVPVAPSGTELVVPTSAIGVLVNVTVVAPTSDGFLSLRTSGVVGEPQTSTVNFGPGGIEANAATVDLSDDGRIQIWLATAAAGGSADVLVDVVGFTIDHNHDDRYDTKGDVDAKIANHLNGTTVRGALAIDFTATAANQRGAHAISFGVDLVNPPTVHLMEPGDTPPAGCSGTALEPEADPGHLCIFQTSTLNQNTACVARTAPSYSCGTAGLANTWGATVFATSAGSGTTRSVGSWALGVPLTG